MSIDEILNGRVSDDPCAARVGLLQMIHSYLDGTGVNGIEREHFNR